MAALSPGTTPTHALEDLAAELDHQIFATTLITGHQRLPHLAITSRHTRRSEAIYAQDGWYWWSWAQRITPTTDATAAATAITAVLGTAHAPTHG
jgi:hypothetical protein